MVRIGFSTYYATSKSFIIYTFFTFVLFLSCIIFHYFTLGFLQTYFNHHKLLLLPLQTYGPFHIVCASVALFLVVVPKKNFFHSQNQEKIRSNTITKDLTTPQVCCYTT